MPTELTDRATYTAEELALKLGVSRGKIYAELSKGNIPHIRMGRRRVIPKAAISRWLEGAADRRDQPGAALS